MNDKYTIKLNLDYRFGGLIVGDLFNIINGDIIIILIEFYYIMSICYTLMQNT